jgi:hypothetical protein
MNFNKQKLLLMQLQVYRFYFLFNNNFLGDLQKDKKFYLN